MSEYNTIKGIAVVSLLIDIHAITSMYTPGIRRNLAHADEMARGARPNVITTISPVERRTSVSQ